MRALLLSAIISIARGDIVQQVWPSSAFAPAASATTTTVPSLAASSFCAGDTCSARWRAMVVLPVADLITFSLTTDGAVKLWVDDHLVIDDNSQQLRTLLAELNVSFIANVPQKLRLDYLSAAGATSSATLSWAGNVTAAGPVPAAALSVALPAGEAERIALAERLLVPAVAWQTYYNPSMGAHVRMPQAFALYATLADTRDNSTLGDLIVYRRAHPAVTLVGQHSYNGSDFSELTVSAWKGIDCAVTFSTATSADGADLYFLATANGTQCSLLALIVQPQMLWERVGIISASGPGAVRAVTPGFPDTTVFAAGATPAPWKGDATQWALPLNGGAVGYSTGAAPATVAAMQIAVDAARARQAAIVNAWGPELAPLYEPMASVIAWNTMFTPYEGVVTPVSRGRDFGAGYVIFDWDNLFCAYMASLEARSLDIAYNNLIQIVLARTMEGFVPNFASGFHVSYDRTEPQIGAFVMLQIYQKWGDAWVVDVVFDALMSWNDWVWDHRRGEGVLAGADGHADLVVLGSDPNAAPVRVVGGSNDLQAARYESGLDNSPMYDGNDACDGTAGPVCFDPNVTHHMSLYDVGMTALYLSDTTALMELAKATNRGDVLPTLQARLARVSAAMNDHMWKADDGLYANVLYNGSFYARYSPTSLFPLISGSATPAQADSTAAFAASPLGFCMNSSYTPGPNVDYIATWWDGAHDNAQCVSAACTQQIMDAAVIKEHTYNYIRVEGLALTPDAGPAPGRVQLATWYSSSRDDYALTNDTTNPPDADGGYAFVRAEGWCWTSPPVAESGLPWAATPLTLWYSSSRKDFKTCGSAGCLTDSGYVARGTLCWAFDASTPSAMPCKFSGNSIARSDAAFFDNDYWRGRIWGPHLQLMYWGLANKAYAGVPSVQAARKELVKTSTSLLLQEWNLFRQCVLSAFSATAQTCYPSHFLPFTHTHALSVSESRRTTMVLLASERMLEMRTPFTTGAHFPR